MSEEKKKNDEVMEEALKASVTRQTKQGKMARLAGGMAMAMARKNNDPLYKKAMKAKKIFMQAKAMIQKKYGMKGKMAARKAAMRR